MNEQCALSEVIGGEEFLQQLRAQDRRVPLAISADLTYRCNFVCSHCYCRLPESEPPPEPELTLHEWDRILGESADEGALFLLVTGGEPLLRQDFRDFWMMAKRRGFLITLFTNASLITAEWVRFFAEWTPYRISVTLYAATEATHRRITGRAGMHERVLAAMDALAASGVPVSAKTLITRENVHEFEPLRDQVRRFGDRFVWGTRLLSSWSAGGGNPEAVRLSPQEAVALELREPERCAEWRKIVARVEGSPHSSGALFPCAIGRNGFHLDPYGEMRACMLLEGVGCNLRETSVGRAWRELIPQALAELENEGGQCSTCRLRAVCEVCPAFARMDHSPVGGPSPYHCALAAERMRSHADRANTYLPPRQDGEAEVAGARDQRGRP